LLARTESANALITAQYACVVMCAVAVATGILLAPAGSSFADAQTVRGELQEHPRIMQAIRDIEDAIANMEAAPNYFGGHKAAAVAASREAVRQLRYWGGSARTWRAVISHLSGEFRCVAYDQRGWGTSDAPQDGYSIRDLSDAATRIIQALNIDRYVLIGHSMGGKVVQLLASQRPCGLKGIVLVATASPTPQDIPESARQQQLYAYDNRENAIRAVAFLTVRMPASDVVEQIIADNFAGSPQAKLAWPTSSAYEDISAHLEDIAVPTLVMAGEQDRQDSLEQHQREVLRRIPGAKLHVIRFWMMEMTPSRYRNGDQYLHRKTERYRKQVRTKIHAYHAFIQTGVIAHGMLQYLSAEFPRLVWCSFGSWLRTIRPGIPPSELVVGTAMRDTVADFLMKCTKRNSLAKFVVERQDIRNPRIFKIASWKKYSFS
jgi:3-oxoadipate enol-lactonase